ncbi:MAG: cation:proton antiporter [Bacteroidales bacterium]|nr:cation:proton antiporter [Bacteroidales bacterium]
MESFISDLAVLLILGSVFSLICKILKQPVVLGYIVAGFIAGPHFSFFQTVNPDNIKTWADIGVIFLLFGMGLEFSFKKLFTIGKVGGIAVATEVICLSILGFLVGKIMKWPTSDSLLLGGMLIMSSTAIVFKAFSDLGLQKEKFASIVFGILVFEDLFAIILMVIVSTLGVSKQFEGTQMLMVVAKLVFFLVVWMVCGIYLIPTFLKKVKKYLNNETLLLVSMGLCLGMVVFATSVGFSSALGAFIMGSLLAETLAAESIEKVIAPIKDLFGAIFFVSVGMMVDPKILAENFTTVIVIAIASILGKMIFTTMGVRLAGENLKTAMQSGFSLAQMGEFSFIVASLGMSMGIVSPTVYPVVIAVSVITTFTTPYCIRLATPAYDVIEAIVPKRWHRILYPNSVSEQTIKTSSTWRQFIVSYFSRLATYIIICIAILSLSFTIGVNFANTGEQQFLKKIILSVLTISILAIFIRPMIHNQGKQANLFLSLWTSDINNRFILSFFIVIRYVIAFIMLCMVINRYWALPFYIIVVLAGIFFAVIFHSKKLLRIYWTMESRFVKNFNARQIMQQRLSNKGNMNELNNLHWIDSNMNIAPFDLQKDTELEGESLKNLNFRKKYNVLIISVQRGKNQYDFPDGDFQLQAEDKLLLLGSLNNLRHLDSDYDTLVMQYEQVQTLNDFNNQQNNDPNSKINCLNFIIEKGSEWIGHSLIDSSLMKDKCMVIAIERNDSPIVNPSSHVVFQENDFVWVMGEKKILYKLLEKNYFTTM